MKSILVRSSRLAALASLCILVAACGDTGDAPDPAATEAARENVEAMAREHAEDTAAPSPAVDMAPRRAVVSERLAYAEVGDQLVYGHFALPEDMVEPLPAVIVIHEWWGLNDNVRAMADRLAGEGYIVLAVDLYGGQTADNRDAARELMLGVVEDAAAAEENLRLAHEFLETTAGAPSIASLGWCFGGGWSLNAAMLFPDDLDAAVIYYGSVTGEFAKLEPINASILGLFGEADQGIPVDSVREFETALETLNKDHEIHIYPGAGHAFANPTGNNYNAEFAEDAWEKTLAFLAEKLPTD